MRFLYIFNNCGFGRYAKYFYFGAYARSGRFEKKFRLSISKDGKVKHATIYYGLFLIFSIAKLSSLQIYLDNTYASARYVIGTMHIIVLMNSPQVAIMLNTKTATIKVPSPPAIQQILFLIINSAIADISNPIPNKIECTGFILLNILSVKSIIG